MMTKVSPYRDEDVRSGRKPAEHVKIALAVVSVLSVGIFIAFCTVLSLLIKEKYAERNHHLGSGSLYEDTNECHSNPCENGATCVNTEGSFTCTCGPGWEGSHCDIDTNECQSSPCENGATCVNTEGSFTCTCGPGWEGSLCDIDTNECHSNPCENGATCVNTEGSFTCTCGPGWEGSHCDIDTNECQSNPCENGATCVNTEGSFTCTCGPGWEGSLCDIALCITLGYIPDPVLGCYRLYMDGAPHSNASEQCYSDGGQLYLINSATEAKKLALLLEKLSILEVWVQGSRNSVTSPYLTDNGEPLPYKPSVYLRSDPTSLGILFRYDEMFVSGEIYVSFQFICEI